MDQLLGRQTPHSNEAEQSVLGSMLIDPQCIPEMIELLRADDFYMTQNRHIFETISSMFVMNETIDAVTVLNRLEERGLAEAAGGRQYFFQLMEITPTAANVQSYAKIVKDKAILRSLNDTAAEIGELAMGAEGTAEELVELSEQKIYSIRDSREHKGLTPIHRVLESVYEHLGVLAKNQGKLPGVSSGFRDLDAFLTGFNDSDLILLAARPGMGKTSAGLNFLVNAAKSCDKAVVMFSLEMSNAQLALRLISSEGLIDSKKLRMGMLSEDEWVSIAHTANELSRTKIYLDDTSGITVAEMKAKCRRLGDNLGMVIIDYLQLMRSGRRIDNRVQEVSELTRSLKIMAKELNVPVICLSQLSRASETRSEKDRRPRLSDLRESGSIEQDADIVIFIHRDDYYMKEESERPGVAEFIIEKNRHGETGSVELFWDGTHTKFTEVDRKHHYE